MRRILCQTITGMALVLLTGCDDQDRRLVELARENARQQADQNREMVRVNKEMAESRKDQVQLQRDLQKQQTGINDQRDKLETERKCIAAQRLRDPIIAAAIVQLGLILACLAPLVLAGYLVHRLRDDSDQDLSGLLVQEITTDRPLLLPVLPGASHTHDHRELLAPIPPEQA